MASVKSCFKDLLNLNLYYSCYQFSFFMHFLTFFLYTQYSFFSANIAGIITTETNLLTTLICDISTATIATAPRNVSLMVFRVLYMDRFAYILLFLKAVRLRRRLPFFWMPLEMRETINTDFASWAFLLPRFTIPTSALLRSGSFSLQNLI